MYWWLRETRERANNWTWRPFCQYTVPMINNELSCWNMMCLCNKEKCTCNVEYSSLSVIGPSCFHFLLYLPVCSLCPLYFLWNISLIALTGQIEADLETLHLIIIYEISFAFQSDEYLQATSVNSFMTEMLLLVQWQTPAQSFQHFDMFGVTPNATSPACHYTEALLLG